MRDLIDRQAAIKAVHEEFDECTVWDESGEYTADKVEWILDCVPSAQPEQKTGRWHKKGEMIYCSKCSAGFDMYFVNDFIYCPRCGIRMEVSRMDEPISRADAIELVSDMLEWEHYDKPTVNEAIAIIRDVAAVQSEPHWIPCAEQLPDTDEIMLVTCAPKKGARNINRAYYYNGAWHGSGTHAEVVAWMPLPEPYREETT